MNNRKEVLLIVSLTATMLIAISRPAMGRLDESEKDCDGRYGKPVASGTGCDLLAGASYREYIFDGWKARAAFVEGKACCLEYSKIRSADGSGTVVIQPEEIEKMLKAEKGDGQWTETKPEATSNPFKSFSRFAENTRTWTHSSGATAQLKMNKVILLFRSPVADQFLKKQEETVTPKF